MNQGEFGNKMQRMSRATAEVDARGYLLPVKLVSLADLASGRVAFVGNGKHSPGALRAQGPTMGPGY